VPLVQKLAVSCGFWILAIAVAELVLSPAVCSALRAPDPQIVQRRAGGAFQHVVVRAARAVLSPAGSAATLVFWVAAALACSTQWGDLVVGDATAITPLLDRGSPYNVAHARIQDRFGGSEPLVVLAEGKDTGAMKDPQVLATMARLQRHLERDPAVGSSFSLADLAAAASAVLHDLEPKWGVLGNDGTAIAQGFFLLFSGSPPAETARYVSGDFRTAPVTFYARGHKGSDLARLAGRTRDFIERHPVDDAAFSVAGGIVGILAAANEAMVRNQVALNVLGFGAIFVVLLLAQRCPVSALAMLLPLVAANLALNAYMAHRGIGLTLHTLPVVVIGVGFGVDFCLYLTSRVREAYAELEGSFAPAGATERFQAALVGALSTSGKTITLVAGAMSAATMFWTASRIRFGAEMGLLLGVWIAVSWAATMTLLPVALAMLRPRFIQRTISHRI
jgi:predicted RND superfamily exporter protein